ncbi:hypothetical protein NCAS_0B06120 [Naumovozyma castellii]|uniref:ferroxidase n=1 Tax=Naumovozyma castellii TaxID=27288 RepID=G0V9S9_NAUCA|nr:hypothetical protein NCAS_0B06120 [Naumovozyma castellii CBS 4309]CCC68696.1 hypothetical protein NCAS_0B06120 [Naumovozyma castellii CBS 4309]
MLRTYSSRVSRLRVSPLATFLRIRHGNRTWTPLLQQFHWYHVALNVKRFYTITSTHGHEVPKEVINLPLQKYHQEADKFLDKLFDNLEELSDRYPKDIPDVDLNHGVMTLEVPIIGSYVINKQPPNKQIWFASPLSGPNRFDFYKNEWISLRDGQKLIDILNSEIQSIFPKENIDLGA